MHQTTQQVNKHWHGRKGWENESNTVKGNNKIHCIFIVFYCEIHLKYCQDTINRQFNSTMENNFAGKTVCSLSYPGAGVR
jgi:hypothetical protein